MSAPFLKALAARRSIYNLTKESPLSTEQVTALVKEVIKQSPSAFNSQSTRAVVIFGEHHTKLWNETTKAALRKVVPDDKWEATDNRISGFSAGQGTVLLFEDEDVIKDLQEKVALYADQFPVSPWLAQHVRSSKR